MSSFLKNIVLEREKRANRREKITKQALMGISSTFKSQWRFFAKDKTKQNKMRK